MAIKENITFLEKFTTVSMGGYRIKEIILDDLYENMEYIQREQLVPNIFNNETLEQEKLKEQVFDMVAKKELTLLKNSGSCFIALSDEQREAIMSSMNEQEIYDYNTLTDIYLNTNIAKHSKQKHL